MNNSQKWIYILLICLLAVAICNGCSTEVEKKVTNKDLVMEGFKSGWLRAMLSAHRNVKKTMTLTETDKKVRATWQVSNDTLFTLDSLEFARLINYTK